MKFLLYTLVVAASASPFYLWAGLTHGFYKATIVFGLMASGYGAACVVRWISKRG